MAQSGGTLSGYVKQNGKTVSGATVTVTFHNSNGNHSLKASTDERGFFKFEDLAPGTYELIAESEPGKGIAYRYPVDVISGSNLALDLSLNMEDYKVFQSSMRFVENVSISADQPQPIDEVSKTVNIITAREMRDRADFSLADTLRSIPGFRVQQLGGFGRTASIKTRGLRNQDTAVLIDGVRFRDAASITGDATPFLSDFTLTSVGRIEVLRGSGSSLYGTNAIGGVIDFQTPTPLPGLHGQISGALGGLGLSRFRANLSDGTSDGKFAFNVGISRTAYTKGVDGQDNAHNTNFQSKLVYRPSTKTDLSGRFFVSDAYVRLNTDPDTLGAIPFSNTGLTVANAGVNFTPDQNDPDDFQRSKFFNGQFVLSQILGPQAVLQAYYSGLKTSRKNDNGPLGVGFQGTSTSSFDGLIQTANAHVDWTVNKFNTLTSGYEFEYEKFGNVGQTPSGFENFFVKAHQSSNTLYAQDLVTLLEGRLNFAGGFRAEFFDLGDPKFSLANAPYSNLNLANPPAAYTFDGSAAYTVRRSGTKFRTHVGNGYRVPSLYERFGTFYSTFIQPEFIALGDPDLKPERSIAYDAGIEQNIGTKAKLTAVYFYTRLIDTIGFGYSVADIGQTVRPFGGYENQKGGIARGAEFSGRFTPFAATDIFASYTYTNSDQRVPQVPGSGVIQTLGIPANQFTLVATQRFKKFWVNFDFLGTNSYLAPIFSSTTFSTYVYRFKGNRRGDLTAGYTFGWDQDHMTMRVFGTFENIFDQEYFENGFRTAGRTGRIGVSLGF